MLNRYAALKERALTNALMLFNYWKLDYMQVNEHEFDFLSPTRDDNSHGACRFNIRKGTGADFAGSSTLSQQDFSKFGLGFDKSDFAAIEKGTVIKNGFDIIGLCQRVYNISTYKEAAQALRADIATLSKGASFIKISREAVNKREHERNTHNLAMLKIANRAWNYCRPVENTLGEKYLKSRGIYIKGLDNIKFHPSIMCKEINKFIPALVFYVSSKPQGLLAAIHRVYLDENGNKAALEDPKLALGSIKGNGIWFGSPCERLHVIEGPENALSIKSMGFEFCVCTVNATNFANLTIPSFVKTVVLCPDPDAAGKANAIKAIRYYAQQKKEVKVTFPPSRKLENGKLADWNDILMGKGERWDEEKTEM